MNINLDRSYPHLSLRGKATDSLRLPEVKVTPKDLVSKSWPHNSLDFYISLDLALGDMKQELKEETRKVRESYRNKCQQTSMVKLVTLLKEWLKVIKKIEFYHFDSNSKDLFYADSGLLTLYECGNLQSIYILSQIQKYRAKNADEDSLTLSDLKKDELEVIYRDVCLKISRHLLTELKNQMYYPSRELVSKLLKFYGFSYNFSKSFEENYQIALLEKKVSNTQESREAIIILFTFKMICGFQTLPDVCYYISYLKNVLLDRTNGVLTAEYETWLLLYEACLKIFARYEVLREEQAIEIDQILSSSFADAQFQGFLLKNVTNSNVTLSSINFYIKNCRRQEKEELKPHILAKINKLIEENFWKYLEDIFEYVYNELEGQDKDEYIQKIKKRITLVVHEQISSQKLYEVEYGLTFILENMPKHLHEFSQILPNESLKEIISILRSNPPLQKIIILFRYFDQFINIVYSQTSYESMDLPAVDDLLCITKLFGDKNFLCHKSVFKFIYYQLSVDEQSQQTWEMFFSQLAQLYFCGGYDENADLEIIHSHESYRECLATKILQTFQLLICSQITERRQLMRCLQGKTSHKVKQSYFMIRSFKDNLLFESIQNICLIFNSHLSMQTLEFGLNYCTPFGYLPPWQPSDSQMNLLSLISEQMPIETLKFIFKEITEDSSFDKHVLESIPAEFWSEYWNEDRQGCAAVFANQDIGMDKIEALQRLRRFEFILNLACCVFDKLNENSQKNIKEIKIIYEKGAAKVIEIANKLKKSFLEALNLALLKRIQGLTGEEVRSMDIIEDSSNSFLLTNYICSNNFLTVAKEFNLIGRVNESLRVIEVEQALLPTLKMLKFTFNDNDYELLYKQIQFTLNIEASYLKKIVQNESDCFAFEIEVNKEWAKHLLANASSLTLLQRKGLPKEENVAALSCKVSEHLKCLLSKVLLPQILSFLLRGQGKAALSKQLIQLMKGCIQAVHAMDGDYEEHFIVLIQRIQQVFRESKEKQVHSQHILSLLQLFFELIFNKIRIRSYHLYRIIKYYQRVTNEGIEQFNSIIAQHIRLLFQEFITNYKPIAEMQRLCSPRKNLNPLYAKFARQEHSLNYIETACTLSMFINLFCRLNYPSLTIGVEKTFSQQEAKAIYIDYLSALTRKIVTDALPIAARDLEILKIDVYGNLNIIAQGRLSERLLNKLISLAKNLLRVKVELRGINKLPIKILADKIAGEQLEINLEEFEDECKAISLGAISLHKKFAVHLNSNLHLCNIHYLAARNFHKYVELNQPVLGKGHKELAAEVAKVAQKGVAALIIEVGEEITVALEGLMRKVEKYYEICQKEAEYAEKLYSIFKILCISCLNNPEIMPLLLTQRLIINKTSIFFLDFVLLTLKLALPLFCEFYTTVIKTNCGFVQVGDQVLSKNLEYELTIRQRLLGLLKSQIGKKESAYVFLPKAINFVQQYSEPNRFRFYKFVKNANEAHEAVLREYERQFNLELIKICGEYISKENSSFSCFQVYEMLEASLDRAYAQGTTLDLKKLLNEERIKQLYCPPKGHHDSNKQNIDSERRSREKDTAISKQPDTTAYRPLLTQIMQTHTPALGKMTKGRKQKDAKQLRLNFLQEDVIGVSESKGIAGEWNRSLPHQEGRGIDVNAIMIEKFLLFNEEIENREFLKDAIIFPSKNGLELIPSEALLMKGDGINQEPNQGIKEEEGSMDNIKQENDSFGDFSAKVIEEAQPVYEFENEPARGSDSIIYSQIEIENHQDGSMKLFGGEEGDEEAAEQPTQIETSKDDILELIEDYTLNPEAIKQIILRIKYLPTGDLHRLAAQQSGEIAYVIQGELRNRGIIPPPLPNPHEFFFVDESKIYERLRGRRAEGEEVIIPRFSQEYLTEWLSIILRAAGEEKLAALSKRLSLFCRRMLLEFPNIDLLITQTLALIALDNNQFELRFQNVPFSKKHTPEYYKQVLVDQIFGVMVEGRIALPIIFFGSWDSSTLSLVPRGGESIMEVLLGTLIRSNQKDSSFLRHLQQYTESLNKVTKYHYPYLDVQDSLTFSSKLIDQLSHKMHLSSQTFSDNQKYFRIFRLMFYLQVKTYQEFLRVELAKTAEIVRKAYQREENVMQIFRKNYSSEEGLELERKAEIYWQLRKSKNADDHNQQLIFCRRLLTDLASSVLERLKESCFCLYYKADELSMKEELLYLRRQLSEARHYSERHALETEVKEMEKRYSFWRRNLINLIIVQEIVPALEEVSVEFLEQIKQTTELLTFLYGQFHLIIKNTPIIFRQCAEYYKLLLAYELLKREEEQTYHSMSTLKTIPSIQSGRQFEGARRRSSLIRSSIFQISCVDTGSIVKKAAMMLSLETLSLDPASPLFALHARHADMDTKLRYLRQENKLGEKVIEVTRNSLWNDTAPHLDDSFGNYDIKIKIAGELGIDYGGVTREWLGLVVKEILDPRLGLFELNVNGLAFQPSRFSYLVPNHLEMFHKFGILVGKAMKENWLLEINFTKSFLKHMLGALLYVEDLEDLQPDTAKGLLWILKNYVDEDLGLNFTYEEEVLESKRTLELVPGGTEVFVNQANKKEYVKKLAYTKMTESIREQSLAFISGVEKVIPIQMLRLFNYRQMGKYFAGASTINVQEMREFAKYEGFSEDCQTVEWFWEVMSSYSEEDKAEFLFFLTGSYRVPYSGFKENPVTINKMAACKDYLPVAHTCFSIIDLPEYSSKDKLERMLTRAVKEGKGFTVS